MVEFGLKLEDNKVSEWAAYYIDYEKLKKLLEKLNAAVKYRDQLELKSPTLATKLRNEFLATTGKERAFSRSNSPIDEEVYGEEDELTKLIEKSEKSYKTVDNGSTLEAESSLAASAPTDYITKAGGFKKSSSGQSMSPTFFHRATQHRYEANYEEALSAVEDSLEMFSECVYKEVDKVNSFYHKKVEELQTQLLLLVDSAKINLESQHSRDHGRRRASTATELSATIVKNVSNFVNQRVLQMELVHFDEDEEEDVNSNGNGAVDERAVRVSESIKRALAELYRTTKLLSNFAHLNSTGFIKIIKKFKKNYPEEKYRFESIIKNKVLSEGQEVEELSNKVETLFATWFYRKNIREARIELLPKKGDGLEMDWSQLRLGYRMGMCAILMLWVCWDCIWGLVKDGHTTIGGRTAFPVFRGCGGLLLVHWFWAISVFIWRRYRINYIYLFDFNPKIVQTPMTILKCCVDETLVFLLLMLLYYKSGSHDMPDIIPPGCFAFLLVCYTVQKLIFPLRVRAPLWRTIWGVISTPLTSPTFFHTYVADVFTSMVKVFQDIAWTVCFVANGDFLLSEDSVKHPHRQAWSKSSLYKDVIIPIICLLPLWFRFNQCLRRYLDTRKRCPNLANAAKYALSQTVTLFGAFHPLYALHFSNQRILTSLFQYFWMGLFIASSLYSFSWDVYMDWGLGRPNYKFLGPRLMFPNRFHYYGVIFADLFLRFMWVLTLIPPNSGASFELPNYLHAVTMSLELGRRTMWGFFRLENEHRQNTAGFRRVAFVPLHFDTGHEHKYKGEKENVGWNVLAEVAAVSLIVIGISVSSIVAAQRLSHFSDE